MMSQKLNDSFVQRVVFACARAHPDAKRLTKQFASIASNSVAHYNHPKFEQISDEGIAFSIRRLLESGLVPQGLTNFGECIIWHPKQNAKGGITLLPTLNFKYVIPRLSTHLKCGVSFHRIFDDDVIELDFPNGRFKRESSEARSALSGLVCQWHNGSHNHLITMDVDELNQACQDYASKVLGYLPNGAFHQHILGMRALKTYRFCTNYDNQPLIDLMQNFEVLYARIFSQSHKSQAIKKA